MGYLLGINESYHPDVILKIVHYSKMMSLGILYPKVPKFIPFFIGTTKSFNYFYICEFISLALVGTSLGWTRVTILSASLALSCKPWVLMVLVYILLVYLWINNLSNSAYILRVNKSDHPEGQSGLLLQALSGQVL